MYQPSFNGNPYYSLLDLSETCFFGPSWMIKRVNSQTYEFERELTHGEDLLFYLSIAQQGNYAVTDKEVLWYRISNNSAMTNLRGLEQGYVRIHHFLKNRHNLGQSQLTAFRRKIRSIMVKSYIRHGQPLNAARSFYQLSCL